MDARAATADLDRVQRTLDTNLMGPGGPRKRCSRCCAAARTRSGVT
ncbi:MAG TPA: hypothetical protein VHY58_06620 [Streptosporangiaceae bacterium]|nr:hypothetical protein [Streptosporangiaceae bacterium]